MSSAGRLPVAVIGAGIGGLSAAVTLRRAGCHVKVYEQSSRLRELGGGVGMRPRTVRILQGWGLDEQYRKLTVRFRTVNAFDGRTGRPTAEIAFPSETEDPADDWSDAIHRGDLHQLLATQVPAEDVHVARRCESFVDRGDHVEIRFTDGSSEAAVAVIAADGIRSVIRPMVSGQQDRAVYSGLQSHRGVLPAERVRDLLPDRLPCVWQIRETIFLVMPLRNGSLVSFDALLPVEQAGEESWRTMVPRELLAEQLSEFVPAVPEIVRRVEEPQLAVFSVYDREPITRWTSNRVTLLGDAAHPVLPAEGQGANQAIQDAVVLAECLQGVDDDGIPEALQRYSDIRIPITSEIHRMSRARHAAMMSA